MQRDRLASRGIDIAGYPLSHLAVRVADWDLYVHQRTLLERHARTNHENVWNGRPISLIVLAEPLDVLDGTPLSRIELIPPVHAARLPDGSHLGVVVGRRIDQFSRAHRAVLTGQQFQSRDIEPVHVLSRGLHPREVLPPSFFDVVEDEVGASTASSTWATGCRSGWSPPPREPLPAVTEAEAPRPRRQRSLDTVPSRTADPPLSDGVIVLALWPSATPMVERASRDAEIRSGSTCARRPPTDLAGKREAWAQGQGVVHHLRRDPARSMPGAGLRQRDDDARGWSATALLEDGRAPGPRGASRPAARRRGRCRRCDSDVCSCTRSRERRLPACRGGAASGGRPSSAPRTLAGRHSRRCGRRTRCFLGPAPTRRRFLRVGGQGLLEARIVS